jgi:predicted metal-dependent hydrolase
MQKLVNLIVVFVLLFVLYIYLENRSYDVMYVKSNVDGNEYLVRNMKDKQQAADLLAHVKAKLISLTEYLTELDEDKLKRYSKKISPEDMKGNIERLQLRFQPNNISESTPHEKYTSYSVNKGEKIVFCLRAKNKKEELVSENIIVFVALHELAHVMTKSVGHTDEFWSNFQFLLKIAVKRKLYQNTNYNNDPVDYCGTQITDTPLKKEDEILNSNNNNATE